MEEPTCRMCPAPTSDVDHIVAIQDGGAMMDRANLQGLCKHHHGSKTMTEINNRRRRSS